MLVPVAKLFKEKLTHSSLHHPTVFFLHLSLQPLKGEGRFLQGCLKKKENRKKECRAVQVLTGKVLSELIYNITWCESELQLT